MRGAKAPQSSMLCLISTESEVPERHPLRAVKKLADEPFFDSSPAYTDEAELVEFGVTPLLHYDPLGRRIVHTRCAPS